MSITIRTEGEPTGPPAALTPAEGQDLHAAIVDLKGELQRNVLRFGQALYAMKAGHGYRALGFDSFDDYLTSPEVDIARSTAYSFMGIARTFGSVQHAGLAQVDWTKLDILRRLVSPGDSIEQVTALVDWARTTSRETLRRTRRQLEAVEEQRRRDEMPAPVRLEVPFRQVPPGPARAAPTRVGDDRPPRSVALTPGQRLAVVPHPAPPRPWEVVEVVTADTEVEAPAALAVDEPPLVRDFDRLLSLLQYVPRYPEVPGLLATDPDELARALVARDQHRDPDEEMSFGEMLDSDYAELMRLLDWFQRVLTTYERERRDEAIA